jgi:hypothetical protein
VLLGVRGIPVFGFGVRDPQTGLIDALQADDEVDGGVLPAWQRLVEGDEDGPLSFSEQVWGVSDEHRHRSGFLVRRLRDHATGRGARLTAVALAAGCRFELVRLWPGSRDDERRLKNQRAVPRLLCPACPGRPTRRPAPGQAGLLDPLGGVA